MYKLNQSEIVAKIRTHIKENYRTQKAYAEDIGVSETTVSFVLNKDMPPTDEMLKSIGAKKEKVTLYEMVA